MLLKACGTRREARCPSCAATYRADAYQLLAAGLTGGKGVPESGAGHPRLFVTFTAPASAASTPGEPRGGSFCRATRTGRVPAAPHGNRAGCWHRHDEDDPRLGEPLCPSCYDAKSQVLWNALAPELWRRTTIALHRAVARLVGVSAEELGQLVRISDAKVAELVRTAWDLDGRPELEGLRRRGWAHMLGFGGHWSTKSRRYSTTFTVLRRARVAFAKRRRAKDGVTLDAWGRPEDDDQVVIVASWIYVGSGYATEGERWLALSAAARAREQRRVAWEELRTTAA